MFWNDGGDWVERPSDNDGLATLNGLDGVLLCLWLSIGTESRLKDWLTLPGWIATVGVSLSFFFFNLRFLSLLRSESDVLAVGNSPMTVGLG